MRAALLLVGGAALAGAACLREPAFDTCDDGRRCASGQVCVEPRAACVPAELAAPCLGQAELAPCTTPSIGDGVCDRGLCVTAGCGNGVLEPGRAEVCDDGNTTAGDGCSFDCSSDERCGNGVIDALVGEQCDDGGLASRDGCSSRCQAEAGRWRPLVPTPGPRAAAAAAIDLAHGQLVWFGGRDELDTVTGDTWVHDGHGWVRPLLTLSPQAREGAAMGYDPHRREALMFGGAAASSTLLADVWAWNGSAWSLVPTFGPLPAPRRAASLTYDPVRRRFVLFGGLSEDPTAGPDVWELDEARVWHQAPIAGGPSVGRVGEQALPAGFDPIAGALVVVADGRTYGWNGQAWRSWDGPEVPDPTVTLAVDPDDGQLRGSRGAVQLRWTGAGWSAGTSALPTGRLVGYLARAGGLVAVDASGLATTAGGARPLGGSFPTGAGMAALAHDPLRDQLVRFGGMNSTNAPYLGQTWIRRGAGWTLLAPPLSPPARHAGCMAFDPSSGALVLFGGDSPPGLLGDTWTWDGASWAQATPVTAPTPRQLCAMVTHPTRRSAILIGGVDDTGQPSAEVWEWTGTWQRLPDLPTALSAVGAFYDRRRQRLIVFGGLRVNATPSSQTFAWDGNAWEAVMTTLTPPARFGLAASYHDAMGSGFIGAGESTEAVADAWRWDGMAWSPVNPGLARRRYPAAAYDPSSRELVVIGGLNDNNAGFATISAYTFDGPDPLEACDTGFDGDGDGLLACDDPDCWPRCTPTCGPGEPCDPTQGPRCGDGVCSSIEGCRLCPADCGACSPRCGDGVCDPGETCPGDCA